nr:hypothetical protein [Tanacetum cinerariifolium]
MEALPSPDYIPGPEAPPSPDYIPGPEAPPSPDYIPGPEYPEYLSPADDVLPAEEQPLPAAVSPTAESPGYITKSEPEMQPEEEDGDDEKSEEDFIEYSTSGGDDDADDDGDDLSEDDADDEDKEESSDIEEKEEEHLALTEGKTVAAPPPFGYRVTARISVQPHILISFRLVSEVERLLTIPTPPPSPVSPTSYPLPPFLMPLPIFTPLPTSSFPLPLSLPSTSGSKSIPEVDIPLQKRARFTTPTGGYEVGKSSIAAARHIRPALTIADRRRDDDRLIGRLRRERSTQVPPVTPALTATTTTVTKAKLQALINQGVAATMAEAEASRVKNGYGSNGSGPRLAQAVRECTYPDFLKCQPLNFKGTEGVVGLTQWFEKMESVFNINNRTAACQVKYAACTMQGVALTWWNSHVKTVTLKVAQALPWKTLKKMMTDKNCPRGEIKKLETEMWELKTKGTDVIGSKPLCFKYDYHHEGPFPPRCNKCKRFGHLTRDCRSRHANANNNNNTNNNNRNNNNNNQKGNGQKRQCSSKDVCGWKCRGKPRQHRCRYNAIIACAEKLVCIPFGNEILTIHREGSNERNESRLNIISCSKA